MLFTKMHGAGNDYVYVDCFSQPIPNDPAALARVIADRHFGVGGDGLILICPSDKADARMRMFNADGSESEMCGNGVRCVAKFVYDHGIQRKETLQIETGAGVLTLQLSIQNGKARQIRVDMGPPRLAMQEIPAKFSGVANDQKIIDLPLWDYVPTEAFAATPSDWAERCGLDPRMTCVSMGNPHVTLYCRDVAQVPLELVGPVLENAPIFPRRINVHFVQIHSPAEITMRTWERGSGITLACGTGASAVCVSGVLSGRTDRTILAHLPGGDLTLEWPEAGNVFMTGPAEEVFSGQWPSA